MTLKVSSWILKVTLNDGRKVNMDIDGDAANEVDSFLSDCEGNDNLEDWIIEE